MKDYTEYYATAAQVIPVLILIYVIEARGFDNARRQRLSRSYVRLNLIWLLLAFVGMFFAVVALSQGEPVSDYMVVPVSVGAFGAVYLAVQGVILLIGQQLGSYDEDR